MNRAVAIQELVVEKAGEWVYFQVDIPRMSQPILEVGFSFSRWPLKWSFVQMGYPPQSVGQVKLGWQEHGDVFFAAEVDNPEAMVRDEGVFRIGRLPFRFNQGLWDFGKRIVPHQVRIEAQNTRLFGLYRDRINRQADQAQRYELSIYFYFEKGGGR